MHGLVRCTHWEQEFTRARGGCDNHWYHNKNHRWKMWPGTRMTSCPEAMGWGFWTLKKNRSWDLDLDEESRFSELADARPVVCGGVPHVDRNKLCLSLLMSKNLKLKKVNKSFVPEPKESRQSVSRIPMHNKRFRMFYISVCIFTFHIFISWSGREYATVCYSED